jgi:LPS-assembly lipoprotein
LSYVKFLSLLGIAASISGCGFSPLYGPHGSDQPTANIKVERIPDREGQMLRNYLLDMLNPYGSPTFAEYRLKALPQLKKEEFGFRRDATSKRTRIHLTVDFELIDTTNEKAVYQDKVTVTAGFSVGSKAETASLPQVVSEEDARKRALEQAAREIKLLVASFLRTHSKSD